MGADTTTLSGLEKEIYEKSISEGVNNQFDLKEYFKYAEADYNGGAGHVWNHHHGRNVSPFWANEDSAYPVAGNQTSSKGRIQIKKNVNRGETNFEFSKRDQNFKACCEAVGIPASKRQAA